MTRQQEYEARLLLQTRQIRICRIMILILFYPSGSDCLSWPDQPLYLQFPFPDPFLSVNMLLDKSLFLHTGVTLTETLLSFLLCTLISLLTALFLWSSPFAAQIFEPFLVLFKQSSQNRLSPPLLLVWLGNRMRTVIVAAVSIAVFGSVMTLYTGFNQMDPDKIRLIYALGGAKKEVLTKVLLPGSLPLLMSTMKVNIGLCLVGVIIGEFLSAKAGLGYLITYASQTFEMTKLMSALIMLCLLSCVLYQAVGMLEKQFLKQ